jgi:hypothetical protein
MADLRLPGNIFNQNAGTVVMQGVTRPSISANKLELLVKMTHERAVFWLPRMVGRWPYPETENLAAAGVADWQRLV